MPRPLGCQMTRISVARKIRADVIMGMLVKKGGQQGEWGQDQQVACRAELVLFDPFVQGSWHELGALMQLSPRQQFSVR